LLETTSLELPDDVPLPADTLAREGSHCGWWRIRHRCPRYRSVAPGGWKSTSANARVAPFDTWGTLLEVGKEDERSYEVLLRDAADHKVRVSSRPPSIGYPPTHVHVFAADAFELGREQVRLESGEEISIYSPERSVVDAMRLKSQVGTDVAYEALRRYLRRPGSSPGSLLRLARRLRACATP